MVVQGLIALLAVVDALSHLEGLDKLNKQVGFLRDVYCLQLTSQYNLLSAESFYHNYRNVDILINSQVLFICVQWIPNIYVAILVAFQGRLPFVGYEVRDRSNGNLLNLSESLTVVSPLVCFSLFLWSSLEKPGVILGAGDSFWNLINNQTPLKGLTCLSLKRYSYLSHFIAN